MTPSRISLKALLALVVLCAAAALAAIPAMAGAASLPDPMIDGPHPVTTMSITPTTPGLPGDPGEATLGLVNLEEPNGTGGAPNARTPNASNSATLQVRGSLYYPSDTTTPAPLIVLVHGNHGSCHVAGTGADCSTFNRNDTGYAYLAQNLASWGYVVFSLDQDQLIYYQDGSYGKGMHQRRLLIAAALDGLYQANQPGGLGPVTADENVGTQLVGKIDFNRIGLMGHSRGGDAVSSFLDYNRTRPAPGRRYTIRAVLSLSPVDYERRAPYGTVFGLEAGACDGDVSNLQGVRLFSRSLRIDPTDPFPRIQMILQGANHDAFNTEWAADGDDSTVDDQACGPNQTTDPNNIRLTQGSYTWGTATPGSANFFSSDPTLMGDQEKAGLATMAEFFRRYVGGETPFDPYMTGEVSSDGTTPQLPQSACPSAASGPMSCFNRLSTSYFAPPQEREDVLDPDPDDPLTVSALGTSLVSRGFANPYAQSAGTAPQPATPTGLDWCNPEPDQFTPSQLGMNELYPTATKPCPMPAPDQVGGQGRQSTELPGYTGSAQTPRENAPVNHSYEPQLTMAWNAGQPASLSTRVPAADGNVTKYRALALETSVNFWDTRNPTRLDPNDTSRNYVDPTLGVVHFGVTVTDAAGHSATVDAGDPKYGFGTQQTLGDVTDRVHVILRQVRIPVSVFAAQGVDMSNVRNISFDFGGAGMSPSGSIQLADVRFQESVNGPTVYAESTVADGPAPASAQSIVTDNKAAATEIADTPRAPASPSTPNVVWLDGGAKAAAAASKTTCVDETAPTAKLAKAKLVKGKLVLSGTALDRGCGGKVASVHVTIAKKVVRKAGRRKVTRCEFVTASGKLGKAVSCAAPVSLVSRQTTKWSLSFPHKLAKGAYTVSVSAIDAAGNVQHPTKGHAVKVA